MKGVDLIRFFAKTIGVLIGVYIFEGVITGVFIFEGVFDYGEQLKNGSLDEG